MARKKKGRKAGGVALIVLFFVGSLVCLFWSFITFVLFQTPLGYVLAAGFLAIALWFAWEGIRKLRKPRKVAKKRGGKLWIAWVFACFLLSGILLFLGLRMILLEQSFGMFFVVILMCLVPACIFGWVGISRISEMKKKSRSRPPRKTSQPERNEQMVKSNLALMGVSSIIPLGELTFPFKDFLSRLLYLFWLVFCIICGTSVTLLQRLIASFRSIEKGSPANRYFQYSLICLVMAGILWWGSELTNPFRALSALIFVTISVAYLMLGLKNISRPVYH